MLDYSPLRQGRYAIIIAMLVIREQQMQAFTAAMWREFASAAAIHCRSRHREVCSALSDAALRDKIDGGIKRALSFGFEESRDLLGYLDLLFILGTEADREPWVAEILSQTKYSPATRLDLVIRTADEKSREEAASEGHELPDATWPEPEPQPVPPPQALEPPGPSCLEKPPFDSWDGDEPDC